MDTDKTDSVASVNLRMTPLPTAPKGSEGRASSIFGAS